MRNFRVLLVLPLLFCLLGVTGCATRNTESTATHQTSPSYLLQHSGVLSIAEKRIALRGVIKLNPAQRNARVVIMNDMGMKLLVAEIIADGYEGYESHKIFASPFLRMIPSFYAESMHCIYEMFLAPNPGTSALTVTTDGTKQIGSREFAVHTIIKGSQSSYTMELFLTSGSEKDS
ncbi:hypothetical protein [Maridesulfovibrio sp.]|uniref:hypothetical protein n=1 Tax=Maridesulfovibrio sp. TaxID=2795000 RepID=UPI0029F5B160|nr:hypothetical protein [Maridesulfovibrio sp.]